MESEEGNIFALGLTNAEAQKRQKEFGENSIHPKKKTIPLLIFLGKFKNPLFILMIGISFLSFFLGEKSGAIFVLLMVFMSALLDFLNILMSLAVLYG